MKYYTFFNILKINKIDFLKKDELLKNSEFDIEEIASRR